MPTPSRSSTETRSAARYLAIALATPIAAAIVYAYGLVLAVEKGPTAGAPTNSKHIYHLERRQRAILDGLEGPRVVLLGGSGVLYSVDAREVERRIGLPVVNFGLTSHLGIDYMIAHAQRSLRRGDVVVAFFEYDLYADAAPSKRLADYVIPYDLRYLRETTWRNDVRLATKLNLADYGNKMAAGWFDPPNDGAEFAGWLDDRGDLIVNRRRDQQSYHRDALARQGPIRIFPVDPAHRDRIARFARWCRDAGISLIGGFPAFLGFSDYGKPEYQAYFAGIAGVYSGEDVPLLGEPREFFFSSDAFFDTAYHLHDESRPQMSALVASRLALLLHGAHSASSR